MSEFYWTAVDELHSAVHAGDAARVELLLRSNAPRDAEALACCRAEGETPLARAAVLGYAEVAGVLVAHGADSTAPSAAGCSAAALAAASGHGMLAALLERASLRQEARGRVTTRRSFTGRLLFAFWDVFSGDTGARIAPWVWSGNAVFVAAVYNSRVAPWASNAPPYHLRPQQPRTHIAVILLYLLSWTLWLSSALPRPPPPTAAARAAYATAVAALASGRASPGLEAWLSHAHGAALAPRQRPCRHSGALVERFDHYCPFVHAPVGLHNAVAFLFYCIVLTVACVLYALACARERRAGRVDGLLDAALLDTALGSLALGQLALWQLRLALCSGTAVELRALSKPHWDRVLYYFRTRSGGRSNPFDHGVRANWAAFWRGVPPPLVVPCDAAADPHLTDDGVLTPPRLHALMAELAGGKRND